MSVNKLWPLISVNLRVMIPNTKVENLQFLRNMRFLAFSGKIARPENPWSLGGLQNQKRPMYDMIELFKMNKKIYYIEVRTFLVQKSYSRLCGQKTTENREFPHNLHNLCKIITLFDHKIAHIFWSSKVFCHNVSFFQCPSCKWAFNKIECFKNRTFGTAYE